MYNDTSQPRRQGTRHGVYTVPTVVLRSVDVGAYVCHACHDRAHGLGDLAHLAIVVCLATTGILNPRITCRIVFVYILHYSAKYTIRVPSFYSIRFFLNLFFAD